LLYFVYNTKNPLKEKPHREFLVAAKILKVDPSFQGEQKALELSADFLNLRPEEILDEKTRKEALAKLIKTISNECPEEAYELGVLKYNKGEVIEGLELIKVASRKGFR